MSSVNRKVLRKSELRAMFPVGKTKLAEDIIPRLEEVRLGPRCVGYTERSAIRLQDELIAEATSAPIPAPARRKRRA